MSELPPNELRAEASVPSALTASAPSMRALGPVLTDQPRPGTRVRLATRVVASARRWRYHDDDMLSVAEAARVAGRSVRTLRRAYLAGRMVAHRDGNGRGVTIRFGDLRAWLTAEVITRAPAATVPRAIARVGVRARLDAPAATGNTELLQAALQRRPRRSRGAATPRPAAADGAGPAAAAGSR